MLVFLKKSCKNANIRMAQDKLIAVASRLDDLNKIGKTAIMR